MWAVYTYQFEPIGGVDKKKNNLQLYALCKKLTLNIKTQKRGHYIKTKESE